MHGLHISASSCSDEKCPTNAHGSSLLQTRISSNATQNASQAWWTGWSNNLQEGTDFSEKCGPGSWIAEIQFREQGGYGLIDVKFRCAGTSSWSRRLTNNNDGHWNHAMVDQFGFTDIRMIQQGGYGLINGQVFGSAPSSYSNRNYDGGGWKSDTVKYDTPLQCAWGTSARITGLQIREQPGYGLVNLRPFCQYITCRVLLYEHGDFSGWRVILPPGEYNHDTMISTGAKNDAISSLKVEGGACCKATVYEHGEFTGWSRSFKKGHYNHQKLVAAGAKNDGVSAIKVVCE